MPNCVTATTIKRLIKESVSEKNTATASDCYNPFQTTSVAGCAIAGYAVAGIPGLNAEWVEWLNGERMEWEIQDYVDWIIL